MRVAVGVPGHRSGARPTSKYHDRDTRDRRAIRDAAQRTAEVTADEQVLFVSLHAQPSRREPGMLDVLRCIDRNPSPGPTPEVWSGLVRRKRLPPLAGQGGLTMVRRMDASELDRQVELYTSAAESEPGVRHCRTHQRLPTYFPRPG